MVVSLVHPGETCEVTEGEPRVITVISSTGAHHVGVQFCKCMRAGDATTAAKQLLRARWFPATPTRPRTAVTFECLNLFHLLTLQGKLTGFDFYQTLVRLTDNTNVDPPKVSSDTNKS